jgi:hypothetical protein
MKDELLQAAYIIAITLIAGFILACGIGVVMDRLTPPVAAVSVSAPVYVETPIPVETPPLVDTITYQVDSMDKNNFRVTTTNGDVLYFDSYNEWDTQVKKCVYTAMVVGLYGNGYRVEDPQIEVAYLPSDNGRGRGRFVASWITMNDKEYFETQIKPALDTLFPHVPYDIRRDEDDILVTLHERTGDRKIFGETLLGLVKRKV